MSIQLKGMEGLGSQWIANPGIARTIEIYKSLAKMHALRIRYEPAREDLVRFLDTGDLRGLCAWTPPLTDSTISVEDLIQMRQVLGFFTKLESLDVGEDKEGNAFSVFQESELACREANGKFLALTRCLENNGVGLNKVDISPTLVHQLLVAREKIARVLGPVPKLCELVPRFGGGATTSVKKKDACARNKLHGALSCSERMLNSGLLEAFLRETPHWTSLHSTFSVDESGTIQETARVSVETARLAFVPKDWKKHRATVTEPTLNTAWQLAVGDFMTVLLRRAGIDLKEQGINRRLAREGSLYGLLATIDLSSASDRIARWVVKFLLPGDWYVLLDSLRSDVVWYRDALIRLEKFTSMGNGFTFPLESLIFWALTASAAEGRVSVYGDDIICESRNYDSVVKLLECCGFAVNPAKSFAQGPFRESCGHDYFFGIQTRPCFLKHGANLKSLYRLHNFYVGEFDTEAALAVLAFIPADMRTWGPAMQGDGHLHDRDFEFRQRGKRITANGMSHYTYPTLRITKRTVQDAPRWSGDTVTPLYAKTDRGNYAISVETVGFDAWVVKRRPGSNYLRQHLKKVAKRIHFPPDPVDKTKRGKGKWYGDPKWDLPTVNKGEDTPSVGEVVWITNFP